MSVTIGHKKLSSLPIVSLRWFYRIQVSATIYNFPSRPGFEPLLTKRQVAAHYGFTTRWVELRMADGMPSELISSRRRFRLSEVEAWLNNKE